MSNASVFQALSGQNKQKSIILKTELIRNRFIKRVTQITTVMKKNLFRSLKMQTFKKLKLHLATKPQFDGYLIIVTLHIKLIASLDAN